MTDPIDTPGKPVSPAPLVLRRYHVPLTVAQVLARLSEQSGVRAYDQHQALPDFGESQYTVEVGETDFRVHCGPPAARGQSGTGMLRLLYLAGHLTPTEHGTEIDLRLTSRRPRWALQRWVGFLAVASLGLVWVLVGPGVLAKKALLYGLMMIVVLPVLAHDMRRDQKLEDQRRALLNLVEHTFGALELGGSATDEPYRKRLVSATDADDEELDDEG